VKILDKLETQPEHITASRIAAETARSVQHWTMSTTNAWLSTTNVSVENISGDFSKGIS